MMNIQKNLDTKSSERFKALEKDLHYLNVNLESETAERRSQFSSRQNISSRLAVAVNEMKNLKTRLEGETTTLKKGQEELRAQSVTKANEISIEMSNIKNTMNHLPGKWSGGSYCILANGACPPGFARYRGHLYAIKMYSHLPQWVGAANFGDSYIKCHGHNCQYSDYAELVLTSCCK